MFFSIRHQTRFKYASAVQESLMEVRKQPRTEGTQRCISFELLVSPKTRVHFYRDYLGNSVHHFSVPGKHTQLQIVAEAKVETGPKPILPLSLPMESWNELDAMAAAGDYWEFLMPSDYATPTHLLNELAGKLAVERRADPLSMLMEVNSGIYSAFDYVPKSTNVDSPIDDALEARRGVCQDFAHVMIAMVRTYLKIPCRYVSGYLFHGHFDEDRSIDGATHAWVEALLPGLGWVGFDPTNNHVVAERHVRTAIGRDYADVPPTHGVFKGDAHSELYVGVQVSQQEAPPMLAEELVAQAEFTPIAEDDAQAQQQQQQ
jgi:transglutaminase-like putative cysteine protease